MTEIPYKQWRTEEAQRCGVGPIAIHFRVRSGRYPGLVRRWINKRVVFVKLPTPEPTPDGRMRG